MASHSNASGVLPSAGQPPRLTGRRVLFASLVFLTAAGLLALMAAALFLPAGIDAWGIAMLAAFVFTLPWTTIGFWNALIGFLLMTFARDPEGLVAPHLRSIRGDEAIDSSTAIAVCIRNEDPERLARNLGWMIERLAATGEGRWFHVYMLSDSNQPDILAAEKVLADSLSARFEGRVAVTWRQRVGGEGFKAGNLRDFLDRWGNRHEYMIVLDADSVMTPAAMLRLVRIMQTNPKIGILQTLVTALPSDSAFARVFQFGMRLGMRSWTLGAAWWQGDCGPYWGHNAIIRIQPFAEHCRLPVLPGRPPLGGHVLSHDQLEAVLMRRAGYEVRVLPDEGGSWEENPPHLIEFIRRDLRWCQGNMQYFRFLGMPGLRPVSRWQLWIAIAMYLSGPGWIGFTVFGLIRQGPMDAELGLLLLVLSLTMNFAPKLATLADVLLRRRLREAFGGAPAVLLSALAETVFTMLIVPICALSVTLFVLGLPLGRQVGWTAQQRDAEGVPIGFALRRLWVHTVAGIAFAVSLFLLAPGAMWIALPFYTGLGAAILITMVSGAPRVGALARDAGLCRLPEEVRSAGPDCASTLLGFSPVAAGAR
ncbi:MAG: glucans biosynthesis glucosyltransferase MdoH [Burkholderiaceae bacterium]|jgi:membrane glycosyltransferase